MLDTTELQALELSAKNRLPDAWTIGELSSLRANDENSFIDGDWIEAPYLAESGIRLIQTGNIGIGNFIEKNPKYISEETFTQLKCKEVKPGDMLICRLADPIGRACIAPDLGIKQITSVDVTIFKIDEKKASKNFILQYLNSPQNLELVKTFAGGSTRQRISRSNLGQLKVPSPPLPEQQKIAEILSTVDAKIESIEQRIAQTEQLKKGLMQKLLTEGIGHTKFKDSELGRIPERWEVVKLQEVCEKVFVGIATSTTEHFREGGVPLIRNQNIKEIGVDTNDLLFVSEEFAEANKSKTLLAGDVVTVRTGYPGLSSVIPSEMEGWQTFTTLISRPNRNLIDSEFLSHFLNSELGKKQILALQAGGAQQNLNVGSFVNFKIILPSLSEQKNITQTINLIYSRLENLKQQKSEFGSLKIGLMQRLLTGKIRVKVS